MSDKDASGTPRASNESQLYSADKSATVEQSASCTQQTHEPLQTREFAQLYSAKESREESEETVSCTQPSEQVSEQKPIEQVVQKPELDQEKLGQLKKLAGSDLYVFAKGVLGFDWLTPHIHMPICRLLELYDGWKPELAHKREDYLPALRRCGLSESRIEEVLKDGLKRAGFVLPRGWLKTTLCSQAYPMWRAVRNSNIRVLLAQNTFTNAVSKLRTIKESFEKNDLLRALFPEVLPTKDCIWKSESLCLNRSRSMNESTFEAAGIRTQVTSRHYDLIIEDDTVAPELSDLGENNLCPSKDDIGQAIGWHRLVTPLLINPAESQSLIVGTRWFEKDLISWTMENEQSFVFYCRACREDENGKADESGEITYPERFPPNVLQSLSESLGVYLYSCNTGDAPILMGDFSSKPIAAITPGDVVIGFTLPTKVGENSTLCRSKVLAVGSKLAETVELTMLSGRKIKCTPDHKWLHYDGLKRRAERPDLIYRPAKLEMPLAYVCTPEVPLIKNERAGAWLAGIFDGEGCCSTQGCVTIAQSPGHNPLVYSRISQCLDFLGFDYNVTPVGFVLRGGWEEKRRFLRQVQPFRCKQIEEALLTSKFIKEADPIVKITPIGIQQVYSFQTETGNYICWGYASKNCLYLNQPLRSSDMVFQQDWFTYYTETPPNLICYTTVDLGGDPKDSKGEPDWNVVLTCGKDVTRGIVYVLEYWRKKTNPGEVISEIFSHVQKYHPVKVGIETVQYQKTLLYWMRERMKKENNWFLIESLTHVKQSKQARVLGLQPVIANKKMMFRTWMVDLIQELLAFPLGANDDLCDALASQLEMWSVTMSMENEARSKTGYSPLDVRAALESLRERNLEAQEKRNPVLRIYDTGLMAQN